MTRPSTCWELGKDYEHYRTVRYKYRTLRPYSIMLPPALWPTHEVMTPFFALSKIGQLIVAQGYVWNGADVAVDTPSFMRGSAVHDAIFQMCRDRLLDYRTHVKPADRLLWKLCRADGMSWWRISYLRPLLWLGGESSARPPGGG